GTWRARSSSASVAAPGRGSFRPATTRPSSVLVWRASSRRWRATTHAYQTVIPPSSSASPATTGGPARRSAALRATGGPRPEALDAEVRNERRRNRLGVPGQKLVLGGGVGGTGESHQLHLVELMHAQQATRILAGGARFAPEARRVGGVAERQLGGVEDLVAMQVGERDFGRGDEKQIVGRRLVHVVLELGDLAG